MEAPSLPFSSMTDDEVRAALRTYSIGLTVDEARAVESMLKRPPTVVEAVIWGIQGSEHCSYKSSRRFLKMFPTQSRHVVLGPGEDSGIVAMTDGPSGKRWGIVVSHESHNHPSQIVPFEGAATGVGGTVRDVACMGARVVGCMDMLRLGDLKTKESKAIASEVMRGIAGYGNPLGIPNLGGDTVFDAGFNANCLVNALAIGIVREDEVIHSSVPEEAGKIGYDIILIGKPTDRSGFGGAAFASVSMEEEKKEQNTGAVQEPNPFLERHLLVSTYALFDWLMAEKQLAHVSFKDLGAGGVVCSTVEQVASRGLGARVDLDKVHVSIDGLPPEVIACAETQERFCWVCHPNLTQRIIKHYNVDWDLPSVAEGARASVIGKVTEDERFVLTHKGAVVCDARSQDITQGLQYQRPTELQKVPRKDPIITCDGTSLVVDTSKGAFQTTIRDVFHAMLAHPNHASKSRIIRHYDKTVIGQTLVEAGEADASVIAPLQDLKSYVPGGTHPDWSLGDADAWRGAAFAADGNPRYGRISAYAQGQLAALESMRNVVAVGATPRALTDCLNYGNPEIPGHLSALEEGVRGIADAARTVKFDAECVAVISGNVSLYNSTPDGSAIPPSAVVACIGVLPDARKAVTMQWKKPGSRIVLLGARQHECGGSAYHEVLESMAGLPRDELIGRSLPSPALEQSALEMKLLLRAIEQGFVLSAHDISDGGLLLALFEMTTPCRKRGGTIGVDVDLSTLQSPLPADVLLFSETPGFLLEVPNSHHNQLLSLAPEMFMSIGKTTDDAALTVKNGSQTVVSERLSDLFGIWNTGLEKAMQ